MRQKILIGLFSYILMLTFFSAFTGEINAQKNQNKKPNERARKLAKEGDTLYNQKDYRGAVNKYAEAVAISPNFPQAHFFKASAHLLLNENAEAVADFDAALEQGFTPMKVYELRWEAHFKTQNWDAALADVQKGLEIQPTNNYLALELGNVYRMKDSCQDAITAYNKILSTTPNLADVHYYVAFCHSRLNDFEKQGAAASEAVKYNTKFAGEAYKLIGDAAVVAKKYDEAILAYERALNVKPELEEVYARLADAYRNQSRLGDAIATLKKGTKLFPDNGAMLVSLTWYYSLADRPNEAVTVGQQAVKLAPDQYMAFTNLCRAYNDTEKYLQAITTCNKALELQPNDGETNFYLARAYDLQKKPDVATPYYKKAVEGLLTSTGSNPDYPDGWYLLGNAFYADGQRDKAIEAYKKNLELNPNFAKGRVNLGYMYFLNNDRAAAQEQYDMLLKIDKTSAEKLKQLMDKK